MTSPRRLIILALLVAGTACLSACSMFFGPPVQTDTDEAVKEGAPSETVVELPNGFGYVGFRAGAKYLRRDAFQYGQVGPDSNDAPPGPTMAATKGPVDFDLSAWGPAGELFLGKHLSEQIDAELRFGFSWFSQSDGFNLPVIDSQTNFLIPYLDAGTFPDPARPLRAGIYGVRYRDRDPVSASLDYDSLMLDGGLDFLITHIDNGRTKLQCVIGPALMYMSQDFDYKVTGDAIGGWSKPTTVLTEEDIKEYFGGLKLGVRAAHALTEALSVVGNVAGLVYYHHASLDADQNIASGQTVIGVSDSKSNLALGLELLTGLNWRPAKNVTVGIFYQLNVLGNAAKVENPELSLVSLEGDNRWAGNHPARLGEETIITHAALIQAAIEF